MNALFAQEDLAQPFPLRTSIYTFALKSPNPACDPIDLNNSLTHE